MNTQLTPYVAQAGESQTPLEFRACWESLAPKFAELMQLFGIQAVRTEHQRLGISDVCKISFDRLPLGQDNLPPEAFVISQAKAARWLAEGLQMFGLVGQQILPSDADMQIIYSSWQALRNKAQELANPPVLTPKMPPDVDPTGKNVLEAGNGSEQPVADATSPAGESVRPAGASASS